MDLFVNREATALVGRTLGEFVIREPLSSGGFGMVFRAEQPQLGREAVIKVLHGRHRASQTLVQRFLREAKLASRLDHPYAAHIYAFGAETDGVFWIAMELVRGTPLDRLLEAQGPIPLERFVPLLERICEVVHTAHEQGIVHRDLKPANVMVLARAGVLLPKLLDFGIAKFAGAGAGEPTLRDPSLENTMPGSDTPTPTPTPTPSGDGEARLTEGGATMGSPMYMAPEQWVDAGTVDARTDLYALGVLSYEALTGRPPFHSGNKVMIALAHAQQAPPALGGGFPSALDGVIGRAMAKRSADRYQSALELAAAFRAASGIAADVVKLPALDEKLRTRVMTSAPEPLAQAVAALDAARNPHQARDAIWQVVRVAVRLLGVTALASHSHVGAGADRASQPGIEDAVRRLRGRALSDTAWLAMTREICRPFASLRDAHPVPELVSLVLGEGSKPFDELLALRTEADEAGGAVEQVGQVIEKALPVVAALLEKMAFLSEYRLMVVMESGAELFMGLRRSPRPVLPLRRARLAEGQPALADAAGVPILSLWPFVQRAAPTPGAAECLFFFEGKGRRGARLVALPDPFEIEDDRLFDSLGGMIHDTPDPGDRTSGVDKCPFPGLAAFRREDAADFVGRERETETFVNRLRVQTLMAVVGPSGAGKSSFVQAGVIPALPEGWQAVTFRPGPAPLVSLSARLAALGLDVRDLHGELREHPGALGSVLRAHASSTRAPLVVVVDQLEELFTLCDDADERNLVAEALARAARSADDPVRVVVTLRDDFLAQAEALPALRSRLAQGLQLLTTPARADLLRILTTPVERSGYEFDDPKLPGEMVDAVEGAPGALALLSFTASKLWELRDRRFRQLGRKAYESLGGVGGALAQHAEATLTALPSEERRLVREVFRHAVTAEGTRAVLSRSELDDVLGGGPHAKAVVEKLVSARLLVVWESEGGGERVEIVHEALLDAWPRLVAWRREDAEGARLRDQLRAAARQWEERGRPRGLLWRSDALAEYRIWRARYPGSLTAAEEAFTAASLGDAARGRRARTSLLIGAFISLTGVVVALSILYARAQQSKLHAQASERDMKTTAKKLEDTLTMQYEDQGRRLVLAGDPLQALAYLVKAASMGASGPAHELLVAEAMRDAGGALTEVHHDNTVYRVRFSPDGKRFVTASYDFQARIWDAATGALVATLPHQGTVRIGEYDARGSVILTSSWDGTARLWDAASGRALQVFSGHVGRVRASISPDGIRVVTMATDDDKVRIWDAASGQKNLELQVAGGQNASVFSRDGKLFAAGGMAGPIRVWDAGTGRLVATMSGHHAPVTTVEFSPDGRRLASASYDGNAAIWDVASGLRLLTFAHRDAVNSASFSPDGKRLVTASDDRMAVVWDAASGQALRTLAGHSAAVTVAVFSPDGARVATGSKDSTARLWDAASGRSLARFLGHEGIVWDVAFDAKGERLAAASGGSLALIWRAQPQEDVVWLRGHTAMVRHAAFAPDGKRVVTTSEDGTARVWEVPSGRELAKLSTPQRFGVARFDRAGQRVATCANDGFVRIYDAASGALQREWRAHPGVVHDVSFSSDGARLASAGEDGTAAIWSAASGERLLTVHSDNGKAFYDAQLVDSGTRLVTTSADGTARVWDAATGREVMRRDDPDILRTLDLDPTGERAVSSTFRETAKIWRIDTGETLAELVGHGGDVLSSTWSSDGRFVATSSIDGKTRIWNVVNAQVVGEVVDDGTPMWWSVFSPDGRWLLTAETGDVALHELATPPEPAELDRFVRCRVPFEVREDRVVSRSRAADGCSTPSAR